MRTLSEFKRSKFGWNATWLGIAAVGAMLGVLPAASQMQMRLPEMRGVWNPVVGSGAAYDSDSKDGPKRHFEVSVIGKEDVNGKTGYWTEISIDVPNAGGPMYVKYLVTVDGKVATMNRTIMQMAGRPPMDMSAMMNRGQGQPPIDVRADAEHVGSESVTTPAGTFACEHYRSKDGRWDSWLSDKVTPWGLVKSSDMGQNDMVLTRIVGDAKDRITGTPQPFNPADMMRQRMGQQPPQ